jgi:hypothetical protein
MSLAWGYGADHTIAHLLSGLLSDRRFPLTTNLVTCIMRGVIHADEPIRPMLMAQLCASANWLRAPQRQAVADGLLSAWGKGCDSLVIQMIRLLVARPDVNVSQTLLRVLDRGWDDGSPTAIADHIDTLLQTVMTNHARTSKEAQRYHHIVREGLQVIRNGWGRGADAQLVQSIERVVHRCGTDPPRISTVGPDLVRALVHGSQTPGDHDVRRLLETVVQRLSPRTVTFLVTAPHLGA